MLGQRWYPPHLELAILSNLKEKVSKIVESELEISGISDMSIEEEVKSSKKEFGSHGTLVLDIWSVPRFFIFLG